MSEEFLEISNKSKWTLLEQLTAIVEVLKKELPFDYLTPKWHVEDGTDDFMVGISARWGDRFHSMTAYTHYLDSPPEPKEMYPPECCAVGTLQITTSESVPPEALEICGIPEQWLVHHYDKWMPLSASYVAFLMGMNQKPPSALEKGQK